MTDTTAGEVRYVCGRLDMTHAPSLGRYIAKSLASQVSGNRMPCMSGDDRDRLHEHVRRRFDATCETVASEILTALAAQPSAGAQGETSCDDQLAQARAMAGNLGYVLVPEPDHPDCPHRSRATPAQPGTGEFGTAEREVGRAVYQRIEKLIGAEPGTPDARELSFLLHLADSVEELGGYDGPREDDPWSAEVILARLASDLKPRGIVDVLQFNDPGIAAIFLVDHFREKCGISTTLFPKPDTGDVAALREALRQIKDEIRFAGTPEDTTLGIIEGIIAAVLSKPNAPGVA